MLEDETYRISTQFRLWSFTSEQLVQKRIEVNRAAAEKVQPSGRGENDAKATTRSKVERPNAETLTVDDEQLMVQWGCEQILGMRTAIEPRPSSAVVATAIQFLRRFYLVNSTMTYHPKQIIHCALWLAIKAEHFTFDIRSLGKFCSFFPEISPNDIRAPEFLLMQALRFTLDVRHSFRAVEGGVSEIRLRADQIDCLQGLRSSEVTKRTTTAYEVAYGLLRENAQMTDVYFLYTPSQIYLAALYIADKQLTLSCINHLFDRLGTQVPPIKQRLVDTVGACSRMLSSYRPGSKDPTRAEIMRVQKKLDRCQDPDRLDIVKVAEDKMASKRAEAESDEERKAKKRKLQESKNANNDADVFGPDLKASKKG